MLPNIFKSNSFRNVGFFQVRRAWPEGQGLKKRAPINYSIGRP